MIISMIVLVAVLFVIIPVVFAALVILAAVFSGLAALVGAGRIAMNGIVPGMILGFFAYRAYRKNRIANNAEEASP